MERYFVYHNLVYTFHILAYPFNTHIHTQYALTQTPLNQGWYFFLFISIIY